MIPTKMMDTNVSIQSSPYTLYMKLTESIRLRRATNSRDLNIEGNQSSFH